MQCLNCGHDNRPGAKFCLICGAAVPVRSALQPGLLMKGNTYRIVRPLSKGGMGALYLVEDLGAFGKLRVIKEMLDYLDPGDYPTATEHLQAVQRAHQRFEQEARTLASLDHPGIPDILAFFSENGRNYIVMEYVEGQDLSEGITHEDTHGNVVPGSAYPPEDVVRWAIQICKVLEYLAGLPDPVIHHDIKPANLVLDKKMGEVRLVDFGTAKARLVAQGSSQPGMLKPSVYGTIGYAPREQYNGQSTPKSDVYALAATMYHLLTDDDPRAHPFDFPQLAQLEPELAGILAEALENEENQRPDAMQLRQVLEQWQQSPHKQLVRPGTGDFRIVLPPMGDAEVIPAAKALVQVLHVPEHQAAIWAYAAPRVVFKTHSRNDAVRVSGQLKGAGITAKVVEVDESRSAQLTVTQKQQLASQGFAAGLTIKTLGADKRCECHVCGHEWVSSKKAGEPPPALCPQCKSGEWSQHRLFKCSICGHEFAHADQSQAPSTLFPTCPACGAADWLPGHAPVLELKGQQFKLGTVRVGEAKAIALSIANAGKGKLRGAIRCLEPWLRVDRSFSGGGKITLPLDTGQLVAGQHYRGLLDIVSSGGAAGVEVELEAQLPEQLVVTPSVLDFGHVGSHPPPAQTVLVANAGGGTLDGTITTDQRWIQLSTSRIAGKSVALTVSVDPAEMSAGKLLAGAIRVATNGGEARIPVQVAPAPMTVTCLPPVLNLASVRPDERRQQVVRLVNNGAGTLKGRIVSAPDWVRVIPVDWRGNDVELTIEVDGRRLAEGRQYADAIRLSTNSGDASLHIHAKVQGPTLRVSPTALDLGSEPVGWLEKRRVQLTNIGLGKLEGTASTNTPWLRVRPARFSGKAAHLNVWTRRRGLAPGRHRGVIEIDSNGGRGLVAVQMDVTGKHAVLVDMKRYGVYFVAVAALLTVLLGLGKAVWPGTSTDATSTPTVTSMAQVSASPVPTTPGPASSSVATSTPVSGPSVTATSKTSAPITPTLASSATETPTGTPASPTASPCLNPGVCIAWPESGAVLRGSIEVRGTARIDRFQYYKFEFRPEESYSWSYLTRSGRPVTDGVLMRWVTTTVPSGNYRLRLVVVDSTGNYPSPHEIAVTIQN